MVESLHRYLTEAGSLTLTVVLQNARHAGSDFQQDDFRHDYPGPRSQAGLQHLIGLRVMNIVSGEADTHAPASMTSFIGACG